MCFYTYYKNYISAPRDQLLTFINVSSSGGMNDIQYITTSSLQRIADCKSKCTSATVIVTSLNTYSFVTPNLIHIFPFMAWEKVRRWKEIIRGEASRVWGDVEFGVARVLLKTLPLILTLTLFNHLPLPVKRHTFHFKAFKGSQVLIFTYSLFREDFF